jgi:hypothetical protein
MWIVLGIIGFLAALITVILLLPVKVIIKNDEQEPLILRYRFLFKTYGEDPDPNNPVIKALKTASGVDKLSKETLQESVRSGGLQKSVTETFSILKSLAKELWQLLKVCKVTKLNIAICCAGDDVDTAAIHYGACCVATYSFVNLLRSCFRVRERGCKVDITCDPFGEKATFRYEVVLVVRVKQVLAGLWRAAMAEAKQMGAQQK